MLHTCLKISLLIVLLSGEKISAQLFIPLWEENKMPNSKGNLFKDGYGEDSLTIMAVGQPGIFAFFPPSPPQAIVDSVPERSIDTFGRLVSPRASNVTASKKEKCAVLICPGGAYEQLAYVTCGIHLAKWFNSIGVTAFVLKYRLPNSPDLKERQIGPIQDAQRAMKIIRANAQHWNIDPHKIGVQGTSAGGHLAACLASFRENYSQEEDSLTKVDFHPDFMLLLSPVISMGEFANYGSKYNLLGSYPSPELLQKFSLEFQVTKYNPPGFIVHALDDKLVQVQNSLLFYEALMKENIVSSLHIFPQGGHNISLQNNPGSAEAWTSLCALWLEEMGFKTNSAANK